MSEEADKRVEPLETFELRLAQNAAIGEEIRDARDRAAFILLFGEAKREAIKARSGLVDADPEDPKEIRRLQSLVKMYEEMAEMVRTAMVHGENAYDQLRVATGGDEEISEGQQQE